MKLCLYLGNSHFTNGLEVDLRYRIAINAIFKKNVCVLKQFLAMKKY